MAIGELVIDVAANLARFTKDMEAIKRQGADLQTSLNRQFSSVQKTIDMFGASANKITGAIGQITAAVAGGAAFKAMVSEAVAWTGEANKMARSMGITTEQASVLNMALGDTYNTMDTMLAGSNALTRTMRTNEQAFKDVGIATRDQNGNYRNAVDVMTEVNAYLSKLDKGFQQNVEGQKIYGKAWSEVNGLMRLSPEVMADAEEKARKLHLIVGAEGAAALKHYKAAMNDLEDVMTSIKVSVGNALLPELAKMGSAMAGPLTEGARLFAEEIPRIEAALYRMSMAADKTGGAMTQLGSIMSKAAWMSWGGPVVGERGPAKMFGGMADWFDQQNKLYESRFNDSKYQIDRLEFIARERGYGSILKTSGGGGGGWGEWGSGLIAAAEKVNHNLTEAEKRALELDRILSESALSTGKIGTFSGAGNRSGGKPSVLGAFDLFPEQQPYSTTGGNGTDYRALQDQAMSRQFAADADRTGFAQQRLQLEQWAQTWETAWAENTSSFEVYNQRMLAIQEEFNRRSADLERQKSDMERQYQAQRAAAIGSYMGQIGNTLMQGNKDQFEAGKAFAIASAMVNTYMAASAAFAGITASTGGWGIALASVEAALAVTTGMMQVAAIESTQYQPRAMGGPVYGGNSYLVGEQGPEIIRMGANGFVTPNHMIPKGGGGTQVTNVFQVSTGVSETVQAEIMRMAPGLAAMSVQAVEQAINSGTSLSRAVGRM